MKIILEKDVLNLGKIGEIKDVSLGYARNYLFPRGLALPASEKNLKLLAERKKKEEHLKLKKIDELKEFAQRLEKMSCTIEVKTGEGEKIFGVVTGQDIIEALAKEGINLEKKDILLAEPIRHIGVYTVEVRLHPEIKANLKVWVISAK